MTKERKINEALDRYDAEMERIKQEYNTNYGKARTAQEIVELNMQIVERENMARQQLVSAIVGA